jgi:uncharacterized protein
MYNFNMETTNYLGLLPEITRRILSVSDPEKIILFGSYARGENDPDSDLDLMVIIKNVEKPRAESNRLRRTLRGMLVPVDLIVATPEQIDRYGDVVGYIYHTAIAEGKTVYERPLAG